MPPARIQPQDPSLSPTYSMSTNQPQHAISGSIRRNLFANHLSRRVPASQSHTAFRPPSPTYEAQAHSNLFSSAPSMQPPFKRAPPFNDIYDPNLSPTSESMFPEESIIALHPATGRPVLPNLPKLPPRLHLSDGDEEEGDDSDMDQDQRPRGGFARSPSFHSGLNHMASDFALDPDMDVDTAELERFNNSNAMLHSSRDPAMHLNIHQFLDTTSDESQADRERIEFLLREMVSRQLARARTIPSASTSTGNGIWNASDADNTAQPSSAVDSGSSNSTFLSSRRRAAATGGPKPTSATTSKHVSANKAPSRGGPSPNRSTSRMGIQPQQQASNQPDPSALPVGKAIDPQERDELVGLIMTSLRRKVAIAEEEGWMYGGRDGFGATGTDDGGGLQGEAFD